MTEQKFIFIFRVLGWFEGTSFLLLLFVGMPLKYMAGNPIVVKTVGMPHGILFMAYVLMSHFLANELKWSLKIRFYAVVASILPFGTFVFEKKFLTLKK